MRFGRSQETRRRYTLWKGHEQVRRTYQPKEYPGRITLFQSREVRIRFPEYGSRWSALAKGGIDCHTLPCSHRDILREAAARIISEKLNIHLTGQRS